MISQCGRRLSVYECMYVRMYVCMYVRMYVCVQVHTRMKPIETPKWKSKIQLRIKSIIHRYKEQFIHF